MTLTDIVTQLKNAPDRLQDCDVEIDTDGITVSEFTYDSRYGVTVAIEELVEVYRINGENANKILIIDEDRFDDLIDQLETKLALMSNMDRAKHIIDDIDRCTKNLRAVLGDNNADNS